MSALDFYLAGIVCLGVLLCFVIHSLHVFRRAAEAGPLRGELQQLLREKAALAEEMDKSHHDLVDLGRQLDEMRGRIEDGKDVIARAESDKKWLGEHESEINKLKGEMPALQEKVKNLSDEHNAIQKQIETKQGEKTALENDVGRLKQEKTGLDNSVSQTKQDLDAASQLLASKRKELADTNDELSPKRDELSRLKSELAQLEGRKNDLKRLEDELTRKNDELKKLDQIISQKQSDADKIVAEARASADQIRSKAVQDGEKEVDRLLDNATGLISEQKDSLQKAVDALERKRSELNAEVGDLTQRVGTTKHCWDELENPAFPNIVAFDSFDPIEDDEEERLEGFKDNLQDHGLIFHPRIINAFHTGLKIAEASPLVVLSGISGTGKSLLPQLYSRAFGMNFLPLAVQPRWDSPQDMLGFYNYMERRFKATELARLLWQYDFYNNPRTGSAFEDEDNLPMNLVLLDEMNIARVEYYFSDFLSKLELRRNINPNDDDDRRTAEIEIEGGVPTLMDRDGQRDDPDGLFSKRLFANKNTLFIGTMNEDESTQTLSDKVIDRSNVIRFGKPANLAANSDTQGFMDEYDTGGEDRIRFSTWRDWIVDKDDYSPQVRKDVIRIAKSLNDAMEKIGRPFGIRNIQAILAYCENYPEGGTTGFKKAMADQIEMKVLPKLNGLEKDDQRTRAGLQEISGILHKEIGTADVDAGIGICHAFDQTLSSESDVFFKWKGISR